MQVRVYADQLERLDPAAHNVAQEVSNVVLALSYGETAQERLDALTYEARRLMLAVSEAKRRCALRARLCAQLHRLIPYMPGVLEALVLGLTAIFFILIAEGGDL